MRQAQLSALADFPEKYALVEDPVLKAWGVRLARVKDYLAFYTVSADEGRIDVLRFLHSRQNWAGILRRGIAFE